MHSIDDPRRRQMLSLYIHRCSTSESILSRPIRRIIAIVGRVSFAVTFILSRSLFIFLLLPSRFTIRYTSPPSRRFMASVAPSRPFRFSLSSSLLCSSRAPHFVYLDVSFATRNSVGIRVGGRVGNVNPPFLLALSP